MLAVLRWVSNIWALVLLAVWGTRFVDHLIWFSNWTRLPPLRVFGLQLLHLGFLVGLLVGLRWELVGSLLVVMTAVPFFAATARGNALLYIAVTLVPPLFWSTRTLLLHGLRRERQGSLR